LAATNSRQQQQQRVARATLLLLLLLLLARPIPSSHPHHPSISSLRQTTLYPRDKTFPQFSDTSFLLRIFVLLKRLNSILIKETLTNPDEASDF